MSKKSRKRGLRHQERAIATLSKQKNGSQKNQNLALAGKTRKANGPPNNRRKKSRRRK